MTTENLIPRLDPTQAVVTPVEQNPAPATEVEPQPSVETPAVTNLMQGTDTSSEGVNWEKRYKDLQSFQSKRENELRDQIKGLETADSSFTAPTTPEQMDAFKGEHPEVYNMMLTLAHQKASEATQGINAQLETYEEERMMSEFTDAQATIKATHPDFMDVVQTAEFQGWAQNQPQQVQQWIYNNPDDPDMAIIALDRYKATRDVAAAQAAQATHLEEQSQQTQADTSSAAQAVGTSSAPITKAGAKIWTASEIKAIHPNDWSKHSGDIDKAYAEGRVNFKA
ncbi:MAG: hypothetical protein V3S69_00930 [Dehalococcoidales bacterium]